MRVRRVGAASRLAFAGREGVARLGVVAQVFAEHEVVRPLRTPGFDQIELKGAAGMDVALDAGEIVARGRLVAQRLQRLRLVQLLVTEIAERAGLTERTFFRYFPDKREVLFGGQDRLRELYALTIAAARSTG